jgi:hypothetical protein
MEESKKWFNMKKDDSTYKREVARRIELINWVLEKMNNPNIFVCEIIESKMNEIIDKINEMAPDNRDHVVFKISVYGIPNPNTCQGDKLKILTDASRIINVPMRRRVE